jgi:hypothetical protein
VARLFHYIWAIEWPSAYGGLGCIVVMATVGKPKGRSKARLLLFPAMTL